MSDGDRIYGWRAIAAYLERDERTAKRWERQRGLPVRRIPGEGRAAVYALRSEVERWLQHGNNPINAEGTGPDPLAGKDTSVAADERDHAGEDLLPTERAGEQAAPPSDGGEEAEATLDAADNDAFRAPVTPVFRPSEHVSLLVSLFGLALLLTATAVRFFHVGPLEAILFASETLPVPDAMAHRADALRDDLYLRGMYLCEMRSPDSLEEARRLFSQAIARDGAHAASYSGLAKTYLLLREYATMPEAEAYRRAEEAAEQAVRLDPKQPEAHAVLGFVDFFWLRRAAEAERHFGLAMEADDRNALAHHWFGSMLMHQGRYAEAIAQLDTAQRLNPTSTAIVASKALALGFGGHKEEGMRLLEVMDSTGQEAAVVHRNLGYLSLVAPRDMGRFLRESVRFTEMRRDTQAAMRLRTAAEAFAAGGETEMWKAVLREEQAANPNTAHPTYMMAQAEAALGHERAALAELTELARDRDGRLMGIMVEPVFLPLRTDAGFLRIAEELGLVYPVVATR